MSDWLDNFVFLYPEVCMSLENRLPHSLKHGKGNKCQKERIMMDMGSDSGQHQSVLSTALLT